MTNFQKTVNTYEKELIIFSIQLCFFIAHMYNTISCTRIEYTKNISTLENIHIILT